MKDISRRKFSQRFLHILMYGGLSHFAVTRTVMATKFWGQSLETVAIFI